MVFQEEDQDLSTAGSRRSARALPAFAEGPTIETLAVDNIRNIRELSPNSDQSYQVLSEEDRAAQESFAADRSRGIINQYELIWEQYGQPDWVRVALLTNSLFKAQWLLLPHSPQTYIAPWRFNVFLFKSFRCATKFLKFIKPQGRKFSLDHLSGGFAISHLLGASWGHYHNISGGNLEAYRRTNFLFHHLKLQHPLL